MKTKKTKKTKSQDYFRYSHLGMQFILVFGVCFYCGYYLDQRWQSHSILTLFGLGIGFAAALWLLLKEAGKICK
jgi:F0F1-type ATP synthase assembly protein I